MNVTSNVGLPGIVRRVRRAGAACGIAWLIAVSGCGAPQNQSAPAQNSNLKPLAVLYGQFLGSHRGTPPASAEEFKKFIQSIPPQQLANLTTAGVDDLFVSSRDHEPYVIVFGKPTGPPGPAGAPVIAYERRGVEGKRFVASSLGAVQEVDEAKFRQWVPDASVE